MPAEPQEQVRTGGQARIKVEAGDAPRRPLAHSVLNTYKRRGPVKFVGNPRRHDADDPGVPLVRRQHERAGSSGFRPQAKPPCIIPDAHFHGLAFLVHPVEGGREFPRFFGRVRGQQPECRVGPLQPSACVDPWGQRKPHRADAYLFSGQPGNLLQRRDSRPLRRRAIGKPFKTLSHEDAVLARELADVRHRAEGHQIEIGSQALVIGLRVQKGLRQLEGHAHPGQAGNLLPHAGGNTGRQKQRMKHGMNIRQDNI